MQNRFTGAVNVSDTHHDSSREQGLERFKHLFRGLLFEIDVPVGIRKASVSFGLCDIARAFAGGNDDSIRNLREKIANKLLCSVNSVRSAVHKYDGICGLFRTFAANDVPDVQRGGRFVCRKSVHNAAITFRQADIVEPQRTGIRMGFQHCGKSSFAINAESIGGGKRNRAVVRK